MERPVPQLGAVIALLAEHDVRWVLTGSFVLAACGAAIAPNDVDVTPALGAAHLSGLARVLEKIHAVPAYFPGPTTTPSLETCRAWTPTATEANLDHLFVTDVGMVDVVPRLCGAYDDLIDGAATVAIGSARVAVCAPSRVLQLIEQRSRAKDAARGAGTRRCACRPP